MFVFAAAMVPRTLIAKTVQQSSSKQDKFNAKC